MAIQNLNPTVNTTPDQQSPSLLVFIVRAFLLLVAVAQRSFHNEFGLALFCIILSNNLLASSRDEEGE
jgi:hypothetical protein